MYFTRWFHDFNNWFSNLIDWPHDFIHWPRGYGAWYDLILVFMIMSFKFDRGRTMWKRSRYIDRLGASFIASDFTMGAAYGVVAAYTLRPSLIKIDLIHWLIRTLITIILGWAWFEMRTAKTSRIQQAAGDGSSIS